MTIKSDESCVGWVALGEEEQRRAKEYLAQFQADNTLDELGFGVIRDAFAEMFFPATNTIMTRTRYLVFIPALCLLVEKEKLSGQAAGRRLTELENELRKALRVEETHSVIGDVAKEGLRRYPSSIYWSALRRLGVFLNPNSGLAYYQAHLKDFYTGMKAETDDDGLSHVNHPERRNWDKGLCDMMADGQSVLISKGSLPESLNFSLTRSEALYLRDKYKAMSKNEGRPSLISHLIESGDDSPFGFPWGVTPPQALAKQVDHARRFSMFSRGATLQYFHLLQRERQKSEIVTPACDFAGAFALWWTVTRHDLANWETAPFFEIARQMKAVRRDNDLHFITKWLQLNNGATTPEEMLENQAAHELISLRERITRPTKSRLRHSEYLKRWNPPEPAKFAALADDIATLQFGQDYRAWIGRTFVSDILRGLEATH